MRALWLNKFDFSGNTEAVINWARGVRQKGLQLHLVLTEVPPFFLGLYDKFLRQARLKSSLNINRQQIQNLLYYRSFDLLHVFHHDLFNLARELGVSFGIPWLASVFDGEEQGNFSFLSSASYITCCNSNSLQAVKNFFYPYNKQNLILIPQGVMIKKEDFLPLTKMSILYIGPLKPGHIPAFQALYRAVQGLKFPPLGVVSSHSASVPKATFYSWRPDFSSICLHYDIIAGFGYYLLQGIAAGKIALILEEKYAGLFSPLQRKQLPDFRAKGHTGDYLSDYKLLCGDLKALYERLPEAEKLREENWNYARENHDLEIIAEKIVRLYGSFNG